MLWIILACYFIPMFMVVGVCKYYKDASGLEWAFLPGLNILMVIVLITYPFIDWIEKE